MAYVLRIASSCLPSSIPGLAVLARYASMQVAHTVTKRISHRRRSSAFSRSSSLLILKLLLEQVIAQQGSNF